MTIKRPSLHFLYFLLNFICTNKSISPYDRQKSSGRNTISIARSLIASPAPSGAPAVAPAATTVPAQTTLTPMNNDSCPISNRKSDFYGIPASRYISEVSYMAYSNQTFEGRPIIWMGSDKIQNSIHAYDVENGNLIHTFSLNVPSNQGDWESLSLGPCDDFYPTKNKTCMYIGNMGNNPADSCVDTNCTYGSKLVYIYKLEEPNITEAIHSTNLNVTTLIINYNGTNFPTNRANSESLFVDPTGDTEGGKVGDLYFITKFNSRSKQNLQRLGKISVNSHRNLTTGLSYNVSIEAVGTLSENGTWTDAAINAEGNLIAVRTNRHIFFYPRSSSQTIAAAIEGSPCQFYAKSYKYSSEGDFESVTFMPFPFYAETAECVNQSLCYVKIPRYELLFS